MLDELLSMRETADLILASLMVDIWWEFKDCQWAMQLQFKKGY